MEILLDVYKNLFFCIRKSSEGDSHTCTNVGNVYVGGVGDGGERGVRGGGGEIGESGVRGVGESVKGKVKGEPEEEVER